MYYKQNDLETVHEYYNFVIFPLKIRHFKWRAVLLLLHMRFCGVNKFSIECNL